jgi:DNA-binding transcriptional regulator GbsR (MarR family)
MEHAPPRGQAHLIVAAVRVLVHKTGRPPAIEEVAELVGWSKELVGHLVRGLESKGILASIKSPFDLRVEVADYVKIEELPLEDTGPGLKDEVEEFHERFRKKQEELQNLFDSNEMEERKKKRHAGLDDELEKFKAPKWNPFGETPKDRS